jgi:hypothetical protein
MLNSNYGGQVIIHIDTDSNIPVEGFSFSQMSSLIRILEQWVISINGPLKIISNMYFEEDKDNIVISIEKVDSFITTNYNLYLPSATQVLQVSSLESPERLDIINRKVVLEPIQPGSHWEKNFRREHSGIRESKMFQLKHLKAGPSKPTTLADRMTGKGNKFSCYVSTFANYCIAEVTFTVASEMMEL